MKYAIKTSNNIMALLTIRKCEDTGYFYSVTIGDCEIACGEEFVTVEDAIQDAKYSI